jgi:succinyl-CoA synthetase alpha subunit
MTGRAWPVPAFALIVGHAISPERPMGHAGAIVHGAVGLYDSKVARLRGAGVQVHATPWDVVAALEISRRTS